jgi:hypothetical protein
MRNFEKTIGEEILTSNIENNEYSYQKTYGKNKKFSTWQAVAINWQPLYTISSGR